MSSRRHDVQRHRGVSLVEALVALAVMAFGMLGMAGIQSTLRANSDIARQRAEAVRIAQETIERARSYTIVPTVGVPVPGRVYYDSLNSVAAETVTGYTTNTVYTRTVTVTTTAPQNYKAVTVDVTWTDRSDTTQQVRLATAVHRSPPELSAALAIPGTGTATQLPAGRNPTIPRNAVDQGNGTSHYEPPGVGGATYLVFANDTGLITKRCDIVTSTCASVTGRLLAGFIRFATGVLAPTAVEAENPPSPVLPVGIDVVQTVPTGVPAPECFLQPLSSPPAVAYACLVHVVAPSFSWSGQSLLSGFTLSSSTSDPALGKFRVCRYTPYRSNVAVGVVVTGTTPPATMQNFDHPFEYSLVDRSFLDHNFLVIRGGDGTSAFACPADNTVTTPFINSNTFDHQPAT